MKLTWNKIAAFLTFLIGAMSVVSGWRAMQGWNPGYFVLGWLPLYNFMMGILTVTVPAALIWRESRFALLSAISVFAAHAAILLILITAFSNTVAQESISAMLFRIGVWLVILGVMILAHRKDSSKGSKEIGNPP